MALAIVYSNVATGVSGQAGPWDQTGWTIPTCNKLFVFVGIGDDADRAPTGVTWNSAAMTQIATVNDANWVGCTAYYLDSPSVGNYTLSVGLTGSAQDIAVVIAALSDAETGDPAYSTNTASSATPSVTVAGSANNDILIGAIMSDSQNSVVKGASLTLLQQSLNINGDTDLHTEYKTATGASAVADWTQTSGAYAAVAISVGGTGGGSSIEPTVGSATYTGNSSPMNYTMTPRTA